MVKKYYGIDAQYFKKAPLLYRNLTRSENRDKLQIVQNVTADHIEVPFSRTQIRALKQVRNI